MKTLGGLTVLCEAAPACPQSFSRFLCSISVAFYHVHECAAAKSLQSCPNLCYPIDGSPPGSPIPGILQARTLEWVAISFSVHECIGVQNKEAREVKRHM